MRTATTLIVIVLAGSCVYAQDQSLGDVARHQRSTAHPRAKLVITDENLPHASPEEASNGALITPKSAADNASLDKPSDVKPNGAQAATADMQKRVAELKDTEEAQRRAVKKFEEELKDDSMNADRKQLFEDGLHNAQQLLAQATAERVKAEKALGTSAGTSKDGGDKAADQALDPSEANASTSADAKPDASDKAADPAQAGANTSGGAKSESSDKTATTDSSKPEDVVKASPNAN